MDMHASAETLVLLKYPKITAVSTQRQTKQEKSKRILRSALQRNITQTSRAVRRPRGDTATTVDKREKPKHSNGQRLLIGQAWSNLLRQQISQYSSGGSGSWFFLVREENVPACLLPPQKTNHKKKKREARPPTPVENSHTHAHKND
ncbi:unnamed protein product [Ectocarpus sp. 12 AP-2014]